MLTQDQVVRLHHDIGDRRVLSVYIDAQDDDPAQKREWRVRLRHMVATLADNQDPEERASSEEALGRIESELSSVRGQLPRPGWVGFATPDRLLYAGPAPAPVPDLLRWDCGIHLAPYVRALKQSRVVRIVLMDQLQARIFRYRLGSLEMEATLHGEHTAQRGDFGSSKRASTSSGTRGEARTDAAQRSKEASTERLIRDVIRRLVADQEDDALVVLGGNFEITAAVLRNLPDGQRVRAIEASELRVDATDVEIRSAAEAAASVLSARLHSDLVENVIDAARSDGRGCLGREHVERALQVGAVDMLVVSRPFSRHDPDAANLLIRSALDQGGSVEEVGGAAGDQLDGVGGVGARLRFPV